MARESNVLVLDEPTNDLDIETLDLLQDLLGDYPGTVILVSHDRDFLDRTATTTIAMEGDGQAVVYAGGWSDYRQQRGADKPSKAAPKPASEKKEINEKPKQSAEKAPASQGLSFTQKHRLAELPEFIDRLGAEIAKLEVLLADPQLFHENPTKFQKATEALVTRQSALSEAEEEWLTLEELASGG
jgi:ATP-binding cassette subfamily F protein uup